ncbi:S-adenosyl-L-methionine-dependent methyltransferase [Flagelloscypha sp. PMI_526]|nr:S-adenosyl-L-methionine-dependent methyltransferase [Flagelloscypha sp. PMI_526]
MTSNIRALIALISAQVDTIEAQYVKAGESYPTLDQPGPMFGALDHDPEVDKAKDIATAAAAQLLASLRHPMEAVYEMACGTLYTAALGFVDEVNIVNILSEAGPQGLHVNEISKACGTDASYIARVLRFLATRHVFREVTPDVFVNNRISNAIKKEKTLKEIKENPAKRYEGSPIASFVSIGCDDLTRSASRLSQFIQNPTQAAAPFNIAYDTSIKYWDWLEEPGNEWRLTRLTELMAATTSFYGSDIFLEGFDWKNLPKDSVCVDVGGRTGSLTKILLEANAHLKFAIQDLPGPIRDGTEIWQKENPEALKSGQVQLQVHDFFTPQPIKNASVYFMRMILHDWPDYKAREIMKSLRAAAGAETKLVVFDGLAISTCVDPSATAPAPPAPAPLLANLGSAMITTGDLVMLAQYDGKERTEADFKELGQSTGWKLETIKRGTFGTLTFSPA